MLCLGTYLWSLFSLLAFFFRLWRLCWNLFCCMHPCNLFLIFVLGLYQSHLLQSGPYLQHLSGLVVIYPLCCADYLSSEPCVGSPRIFKIDFHFQNMSKLAISSSSLSPAAIVYLGTASNIILWSVNRHMYRSCRWRFICLSANLWTNRKYSLSNCIIPLVENIITKLVMPHYICGIPIFDPSLHLTPFPNLTFAAWKFSYCYSMGGPIISKIK